MKKNREVFAYLFFGVLTTLVNYIVYFIATRLFHVPYLWANALAWVLAVLFAYITNRRWVFISKNPSIISEMSRFFAARLASLGIDMAIMYIGIDVLGFGEKDFWVKTLSQVVVILLNYIFSKIFVFREKRQ